MKQQTLRAIAKNFVIAAVMGLTVFASWAVTGIRHSPVEIGITGACAMEGVAAGLQQQCKLVAPHG